MPRIRRASEREHADRKGSQAGGVPQRRRAIENRKLPDPTTIAPLRRTSLCNTNAKETEGNTSRIHQKMSYQRIQYISVPSPVNDIFRRCDWFLADVHEMLDRLPDRPNVGGGNWSIAVVLLCMADGLSKWVYPINPKGKKHHRKRFERFIQDHVLRDDSSIGSDTAAGIYEDFRGILVHDLAVDRKEDVRNLASAEPAVSKWWPLPKSRQNVGELEQLVRTNYRWPVLQDQPYSGKRRDVLCAAALYGAMKRAVIDLIADKSVIEKARREYPSLMEQVTVAADLP